MSAATLTAGRALDAQIAEQVMGCRWHEYTADDGAWRDNGIVAGLHRPSSILPEGRLLVVRLADGSLRYFDGLPRYSTDIAAAWPVAHQMGPRYPEFFVALSRLLNDETDFLRPLAGLLAMPSDKAAWFICRAALATVEATS